MAHVPGFEYDVFVSYAHSDNLAVRRESGWVSRFVDILHAALRQRLGGAADLRIFFDKPEARANFELTELPEVVRRSAIFLAVGSASYVTHDWTRRELESFNEAAGDGSRIFVVECLPPNDGDSYPPAIGRHVRQMFWRRNEPESRVPIPLSPDADETLFLNRIHDLADAMKTRLLAMKAGAVGVKGANASKPSASLKHQAGRAPAVLVAQTTDDLEQEADTLRRYLSQFCGEIEILPENGYSQGGAEFRAEIAADLARADIFVQLLGARAGRAPRDLPEGYTRYQSEAAKSAGVHIMQWRHASLSRDDVADLDHRSVLFGEKVIASTFEAFKASVLSKARSLAVPAKPTRSSLIFVDADTSDLDVARQVQRELAKHSLSTILPVRGASAEENRSDLEENLIDCDALILVYGNAAPVWVRGQLKLYNKVRARRESDPKLIAIYVGPPAEKPDHGFSLPEAREVVCGDSWNLEALGPLISELEN